MIYLFCSCSSASIKIIESIECKKCGESFPDTEIEKHEKGCKKKSGAPAVKEKKKPVIGVGGPKL